LLTHF